MDIYVLVRMVMKDIYGYIHTRIYLDIISNEKLLLENTAKTQKLNIK